MSSDALLAPVEAHNNIRPFYLIINKNVGVQGGSETSNVVRVGDGGTDEKTGGGDGGGRVEDVTIFIRSDKNGQNQE